jgi:hypothetical protein
VGYILRTDIEVWHNLEQLDLFQAPGATYFIVSNSEILSLPTFTEDWTVWTNKTSASARHHHATVCHGRPRRIHRVGATEEIAYAIGYDNGLTLRPWIWSHPPGNTSMARLTWIATERREKKRARGIGVLANGLLLGKMARRGLSCEGEMRKMEWLKCIIIVIYVNYLVDGWDRTGNKKWRERF